ncbi:RHS repeat domain-containing protein [Lysobacter sp. Root667]|uniref:RHS repeat domain-containing protein n=1 Tax=Lysobacter sp. Root667 TaxID=1736581 RepID=UPI000AA210CF|nr:RHS repeat domain-containing protein [Lysobacter sp. Root667]
MRYLIGALLTLTSCAVYAQKAPWEEYDKLIKSAQTIKSEGPTLFGDSVNLYTGATSFATVDVSIPGNFPIPVALGRRFSSASDARSRPFGDWDWDVPYISGNFSRAEGWVLGTSAATASVNRCSYPTSPETARPPLVKVQSSTPASAPAVQPWEYWSGYNMSVAGGSQELLIATAETRPRPTDGGVYPWVTNKHWHLSCVPSLQSGQAGEGFMARSPDGTRYRFDWMVARPSDDLLKPVVSGGVVVQRPVPRDEIRLYPTRIEDRFGNWVAYGWSGNKLLTITSSDGRQLSLTWENVNGYDRVTKVATNTGREWNYSYSPYSQLTAVTLPDSSQWAINFSALWGNPYYEIEEETMTDGRRVPLQDKAVYCSWMRKLRPLTRTATIRHPSGASGEFVFQTVRHGRKDVPFDCIIPPIMGPRPEPDFQPGDDTLSAMIPARFDVLALQTKRVTGPGLPGHVWSYSYTTPIGSWEGECPSCATTKTTTVTDPDGDRTVNTYGVVYNDNEGQLLKVDVYAGSSLLRSSTTSYLGNAAASQQAFADRMGISPQIRLDSFSSERQRPKVFNSVQQDSVRFDIAYETFDEFAQVTRTGQSSTLGYSRTDLTEYFNDKAKWMIGQVQRETNFNTAAIPSRTEFDPATALPVRTFAYEKPQQTLAYNADGTLASVADGRGLATAVSDWKRGMPQTVRFHDGSQKLVTVDGNGWIGSVTDENGYSTGYAYDSMGRIARVTPPAGDDVAWLDTVLQFEPVAQAEYGVEPGHWRQVVTTGNRKKVVVFDALWRPVVELEEDASNPSGTRRWNAKRYDEDGRTVFASYPRNPFVDGETSFSDAALKGTKTSYDALGRPTRTVQDGEEGPLTTAIDYLAGFKRRTTDPRGIATSESFDVYGTPSYDAPRQIDAAENTVDKARTTIVRDVLGNTKEIVRGPGG